MSSFSSFGILARMRATGKGPFASKPLFLKLRKQKPLLLLQMLQLWLRSLDAEWQVSRRNWQRKQKCNVRSSG